jgi:ATP-dependent DNA helicase
MQFDDKKRSNRELQIKQLRRRGGILITSYGMASSERINLTESRYDIVVLDEGHKAKNRNTQFRRDVQSFRVKKHRMILTGTPLQNNFSELWSVFDLVQPKIFGSFDKFQSTYAN